jgi:hypothetical protein
MAIKELFSLVQSTVDIARDGTAADIHAGWAVARDANGKAVPADRVAIAAGTQRFVGLAADDAARTGNSFIQSDPVGSSKINADGTFAANNNAFFSSVKRALGDYQDETVSNISDLTSGSTGYQGPRRGLGIYNYTPGTQFIIDGICIVQGKKTDAAATDAGNATWAINDLLSIGVTANKGKFIVIDDISADVPGLGAVAQIDKISGSGDGTLVWITLI